MRTHGAWATFLLTLLLSLSLAACFGGHGGGGGGGTGGTGNGGGGGPNGSGAVVQLLTKPASVPAGSQFVFQANTMHNHANPQGVNWTINPTSGQGTLTNPVNPTDGNPSTVTYTAPATTCNQCVTITATSIENPSSTDFVTFSIAPSGNVSLLFGQYAFLFSGFDANGAVSVAGSINVDQNGNVIGEEDFKDPKTLVTAASVSGNCQNFLVAASGFCNLTVGGKTSRYDFVLRNNGVARLAEDPADGANVGSGVLISQQVPSSNALTTAGGFNGFFSIGFDGTDATGGRIALEGNIFTNLGAVIVPQGGIPSQADINDNGTVISPVDSMTTNVTGSMTGPVDQDGRATMTMTVGTSPASRTLTLALYILAPEVPLSNQSGRAFAIDITPIPANSTSQVLSGQLFWLGNNPSPLPFSNSSISGVNVFAISGVVPGSAGPPATAPSSNTAIGSLSALTAQTGQVLLDVNTAGNVNNGAGVSKALTGTYTLGIVAANGRVVLTVTVGVTIYTYVLYLDAANDGNVLETGGDNTVSFGFFTGQVPTNKFGNVGGTYVAFTTEPVLPGVPNAVSPVTLTTPTLNGTTLSGTFSASSASGTYSFDATTGRGIALANSGQQLFQNSSVVFYVIAPKLIVVMGADQGVKADAIGSIQF